MKDFEGTEIKVGDEVIQTGSISGVKLRRRLVTAVDEKFVTLAPLAQPKQAHQQMLDRMGTRKRAYEPRSSVCHCNYFLFVIPKQG